MSPYISKRSFSIITYAILLVPIALSGIGCSTLQAPSSQYEEWTPPKWEKTTKYPHTTWETIREQKLDATEPLTLTELVEIALKNNPSTRQAWEDARAEAAELREAQSELYPQVTASLKGTREKEVANIASADLNELRYGPSGKLTFLVLDLGGRGAKINDAWQQSLASNFQFNQSLQDLLLDIEKAYFGLYSAFSMLEAAEADVLDAQTSYVAAKKKFQVGLASKLDELQAKATYDNSLYNLEDAKGNVQTQHADLAQALGFAADIQFDIARPKEDVPADVTRDDVSELIELALDKRPDIAAQRAMMLSKQSVVIAANSNLWPSLNFGGTIDHDWYKFYNASAERDNAYDYAGFLSLDWDVFNGFENLSKKRAAQREADAELEQLKGLELQASAEVWKKYYAFKTAVQKLVYSKSYLESAQAAYDLALLGYETGLKSILDLLESQSELSEARSKLVTSREDTFVSLAELAHATGTLYIEDI